MTLKFPKELIIDGTEWTYTPFRFNIDWINTGSYTPSYRDVTVTGMSPLNLPNAEANGLKSFKIFGATSQTGTPSTTNYVPIQAVGVKTANLIDVENIVRPEYITTGAGAWSGAFIISGQQNEFLKIFKPNTTYRIEYDMYCVSVPENATLQYSGIGISFSINGVARSQPSKQLDPGETYHVSQVYTTGDTVDTLDYNRIYTNRYTRAGGGSANAVMILQNLIISEGSESIPYEPYGYKVEASITNGSQSQVETVYLDSQLYKLSDTYIDSVQCLSGEITKNIVTLVLDGTESWQMAASYIKSDATDAYLSLTNALSQSASTALLYCTHCAPRGASIWALTNRVDRATFNNKQLHLNLSNVTLGITDYQSETTTTALAKFKAYLAAQYAAGTPVIVVYPRSTPRSETTTPIVIQTFEGDNTLTITQGATDGLQMEVTYSAGVEVTIETVENANVDQQVEVVIGE